MLEITPDNIAQLADDDLRTLVGLLCEAELARRGLPVSGVTWGGNQRAADGGLTSGSRYLRERRSQTLCRGPTPGFRLSARICRAPLFWRRCARRECYDPSSGSWPMHPAPMFSDKNERGTGEKGQERDTRQVASRRQGGNLNF